MKKKTKASVGLILFSLLAITVIVVALLPGLSRNAEALPTATLTVLPTTTSTPDPCSPEDLQTLVPDFHALSREFDDFSVLAQNTPREDLSPAISELQRIRRASERYDVPGCMRTMKELQLAYMNAFIDTLVALYATLTNSEDGRLTESDVLLINQGMSQAIEIHDQYLAEVGRLLGVTLIPPTTVLDAEGPEPADTTPTP